MKEKTLLIVVLIILLVVAGSIYVLFFIRGGIIVNGGRPSSFGPPGGAQNPHGPPSKEHSVGINASIRFFDGTSPEPVGNIPDIYVFKNLSVYIVFGKEQIIRQATVKKYERSFIFGDVVFLERPVSSYKSLTSITFKAPGYKDIHFENLPVMSGNIVRCPDVVMKK
ncbi:MAG: hypothetical protein M1536_07255 [Firmicutes bacterium]|nr:hypothetical protein [Bacillota bacterium]